jgi:hypothetical protein
LATGVIGDVVDIHSWRVGRGRNTTGDELHEVIIILAGGVHGSKLKQ